MEEYSTEYQKEIKEILQYRRFYLDCIIEKYSQYDENGEGDVIDVRTLEIVRRGADSKTCNEWLRGFGYMSEHYNNREIRELRDKYKEISKENKEKNKKSENPCNDERKFTPSPKVNYTYKVQKTSSNKKRLVLSSIKSEDNSKCKLSLDMQQKNWSTENMKKEDSIIACKRDIVSNLTTADITDITDKKKFCKGNKSPSFCQSGDALVRFSRKCNCETSNEYDYEKALYLKNYDIDTSLSLTKVSSNKDKEETVIVPFKKKILSTKNKSLLGDAKDNADNFFSSDITHRSPRTKKTSSSVVSKGVNAYLPKEVQEKKKKTSEHCMKRSQEKPIEKVLPDSEKSLFNGDSNVLQTSTSKKDTQEEQNIPKNTLKNFSNVRMLLSPRKASSDEGVRKSSFSINDDILGSISLDNLEKCCLSVKKELRRQSRCKFMTKNTHI